MSISKGPIFHPIPALQQKVSLSQNVPEELFQDAKYIHNYPTFFLIESFMLICIEWLFNCIDHCLCPHVEGQKGNMVNR